MQEHALFQRDFLSNVTVGLVYFCTLLYRKWETKQWLTLPPILQINITLPEMVAQHSL